MSRTLKKKRVLLYWTSAKYSTIGFFEKLLYGLFGEDIMKVVFSKYSADELAIDVKRYYYYDDEKIHHTKDYIFLSHAKEDIAVCYKKAYIQSLDAQRRKRAGKTAGERCAAAQARYRRNPRRCRQTRRCATYAHRSGRRGDAQRSGCRGRRAGYADRFRQGLGARPSGAWPRSLIGRLQGRRRRGRGFRVPLSRFARHPLD